MFTSKLPVIVPKRILSNKSKLSTTKITTNPFPIVTVLDVLSSPIGRHLALLLKQSPFIDELRLYDKNQSVCYVGEDLSHIDTRTKITSFGGSSTIRAAVEGASIVISVGGCKKKPGEPPLSLFEKNFNDVKNAAMHLTEFNPKAVFCLAKPPIEALVPMVSEEYKKAGVYDERKIIGITTAALIRANYFIGKASGQDPAKILCPIVGGFSEKTTVAAISQTRPRVSIDPKNFSMLQDCIAYAEDDVLSLYGGCNTVCLAPALGISRFVNNLLKALSGNTNCVECAFVHQTGQIGQFLTYMTSIVKLGQHGIESSHMPKINEQEAIRLKAAAVFIRQNIRMGENYGLGNKKESKSDCLKNQDKCNLFEKKSEDKTSTTESSNITEKSKQNT